MTFFVDANVIVYGVAEGSPYRQPCVEILAAVAGGSADGRTSTAVLEEVWQLELTGRAGVIDGLTARAYAALGPLLPVTDEAFRRALGLAGTALDANDRVHVGTCVTHGIDTMVSADRGFDSVDGIRRVDPLDAAPLLSG